MTAQLKRCPFCNSHRLILEASALAYWIKCQQCGACGPTANNRRTGVWYWNEGAHNDSALVADRASNRNTKRSIEL